MTHGERLAPWIWTLALIFLSNLAAPWPASANRVIGGTISDVWFDRSEQFIRYYEVLTTPALGGRKVLVPAPLADVQPRNEIVSVPSILGAQFKDVPGTKSPVQVTLLEEDKISGYYGGGTLWATPARSEPLI